MSSTRITDRRLQPRKLPKQARSGATVEAILEAAAQIFERHGYAAGTTNRIAARAGVSIGSLYQYFPNKDAILLALVHRHLAEGTAALEPQLERLRCGGRFDDVLADVVHAMVALHALAPGLHRVLFEETQLPSTLRAELDELEDRLVDLAADALAADARSRPIDPRLSARIAISAIEGLTHRLVLRPPPGVSADAIAGEITEIVRAYIHARRAPAASARAARPARGATPRVGGHRTGSPTVSEQHERLLRRAYEAFNARDIEGALATMHPQVDWPNAIEGGRAHGHAEVRAYWERQWGSLDSRVQPLGIEQGAGGRAVATVRQLVRDLAGNVLSDGTVEHRYVIAGGLIERMDVHDHWTIRSAGEQDIAAVLELWAMAGSLPSVSDSPEGLARLLAADPQALLVAERDGSLAGSLIAAWDGWRGSFYRMAVSPEHRRKGLATMLLREGERRLRERGAVRLTAIVADDQAGAIAFWRAAGYERQQHRARFVRQPDA